jgi:hypothetical protein
MGLLQTILSFLAGCTQPRKRVGTFAALWASFVLKI